MPIDPSIISNAFANAASNMPDVDNIMAQRVQGMENIYKIETARQAAAKEEAEDQEAAALRALTPAVAMAFSDPSDAGLNAAFSMVPEQYAGVADEQLAQLRAIPDVNRRKAVIRSALLQDDYGRALLAQLEPTANMRLQAETAARRAELDQRRFELDMAKLEAEAKGGKIVQWVTDDAGNVTGLDAQGNIVATQPGIGKKAAPAGGGATQESERLAAYNAGRALNAAKRISEAAKTSPDAEAPGWLEATASAVGNPNIVRSEDRQIVVAAQRDLIDALLTLATGAAYNKEQLEGQMESYIPKWSDKPKARANKRQALLDLIAAAKVKAGRAWTPEMESTFQSLVAEGSTSEQPALPDGATTTNW